MERTRILNLNTKCYFVVHKGGATDRLGRALQGRHVVGRTSNLLGEEDILCGGCITSWEKQTERHSQVRLYSVSTREPCNIYKPELSRLDRGLELPSVAGVWRLEWL